MIITVKDTELKDNQFKCDACCSDNDKSAVKCQQFEFDNNLGCCTVGKHHYVRVGKGE